MNLIQRSTLNAFASATGYVAPLAINIIATPILLDRLGAEAFGIQNLVNAIMGYFFVLEAGLDFAVIRYLSEDRAQNNTKSARALVGTSLTWYLAVGLIGAIIILLSAEFFAEKIFAVPEVYLDQAVVSFQLAGIGFLAGMIGFWARAVSAGYQRYEVYNSVNVSAIVIGTSLGIVLVLMGYGLVAYVGARIGVSIVVVFVYYHVIRRLVGSGFWRTWWNRVSAARIRSYIPLGFVGRVNGVILMWLDNTLIALWLGPAALAAYVPAFSIVNIAIYFTASTLHFIYPMAGELYHADRGNEFRQLVIIGVRFIAGLAIMVFIPLAVFGDIFLTLWLGPAFASMSTTVFRLLAVAGLITTMMATVPNNIMPATGHMRVFTIFSTIRTSTFAVACFFFIRSFGINGAGMALIAAACIDITYVLTVYRRYLDIPTGYLFANAYARPLLLGLAFLILSWAVRPLAASWVGLFVTISVLCAAYIAAGFRFGVFGDLEKRALNGIVSLIANRFLRVHTIG